MSLIPRHFSELLNYTFVIPPYQRGYRWDDEQVTALLNDLKEFSEATQRQQNAGMPVTSFYCLQPIVVVPVNISEDTENSNTSSHTQGKYTVIDGQQRLTTIFLLLSYLQSFRLLRYNIFRLEISARPRQHDFITQKKFVTDQPTNDDNIDTFYMRRAYKSIETWFDQGDNQYYRHDILRLLVDPNLKNDVRIIWYEITNMSAPQAFRRLNYGKIPLTSTELVKALLLQGSSIADSAPYRRAVEWDNMEHALNNPYVWGMLSDKSDPDLSHMSIILDFVADNINKILPKPFVRKSESRLKSEVDGRDYFNYHVINEYISSNSTNAKSRDMVVEKIWTDVRDTFNLITNWYDDRKWYHLIGLLRILQDKKSKKKNREFIRDMFNMAYPGASYPTQNISALYPADQKVFEEALRHKVGDLICLNKDQELKTLSYGQDNSCLIKILTALNVYEAIFSEDPSMRFSFSDFEDFNVTSLEHIHPQNITTDQSYEDFLEWFENRVSDKNDLSESDWMKIVSSSSATKPDDPGSEEEMGSRIEKYKEDVESAERHIRRLSADKSSYRENKSNIMAQVTIFDKIFGDLAGIDDKELHSISNLALVDVPTNSALQNFFLDKKRGILSDRHLPDSNGKRRTYVPCATFKVFSKEWSKTSPGDMRLWRPEDRKPYFDAIKKAYNYFTSK